MNLKKNLTALLPFFLFPAMLFSQQEPAAVVEYTLNYRLNLAGNLLERTGSHFRVLMGGAAMGAGFLLDSVAIESGELVVYYHLPRRHSPKEGADSKAQLVYYAYRVLPGFALNGQALVPEPEYLLGDIGAVRPKAGNRYRIAWAHLLQDYINIEGELEVTLHVEEETNLLLVKGIICGAPPVFNTGQRLPYYLVAGAGAGLIGVGILEKIRSNDIYDNQYAIAKYPEAKALYNKANSKHHNYILFTTAGAAIIATDALLYYSRLKRYREQKSIFDQYCNPPPLTLHPVVEPPLGRAGGGQLGLRLAFQF